MPLHTTDYLLRKIELLNAKTFVSIRKIPLTYCDKWHYDEMLGEICNQTRSFFQVKGIEQIVNGRVIFQQPIIIQPEIGYLGIIRKEICNEMHYLMQYKIEPGNINCVQISPTIQATKSNFLQKHGGKKPEYLNYFMDSSKHRIIYDQIQSEQSSRFLGKRNRNILIEIDENEEITVLSSHDWMTLSQIKQLMQYDNVVNMDTRTVLSGLLVCDTDGFSDNEGNESLWIRKALRSSRNQIIQIYHYINNYKMYCNNERKLIPLFDLADWHMNENEFISTKPSSFKLIFCEIEIQGREVQHWCQPLFEATSVALFGLFICLVKGERHYLVKCQAEIGCFDGIEIGPTIQIDSESQAPSDSVEEAFQNMLQRKQGVIFDTMLSEEGGRFYHEQNRNVIIMIDKNDLHLPDGYFWCNLAVLRQLMIINNTLNIQLRNLLSVLR